MFILKHFKKLMGFMKMVHLRRKWQRVLLKGGFLKPKKTKDEKLSDLELFKSKNLTNYLKSGI